MQDTLGAFVPGSEVTLEGAAAGPLAGLEFAAKDIYDVAGHVTGCGNPDWARTHPPAEANAPAVQAWLDAGARLVGKTITDELAYSLNGQNAHYGTPTNVNAPGRIPGGSSSGSAAAVAGGLADLALGSDTGGSVRVPAGYCGIYGIRTSHGRIPLAGIMPLAPGFDTVGWFARDPAVLRRAGEVLMAGDADSAPAPGRLLIAEDAFALAEAPARAALMPVVERLEARLGKAEPVTLGEPGGGLESWMWHFRHLQGREIWDVHGVWITEVKPRFGAEITERFEWARNVPDEAVAAAVQARAAFTERISGLLEGGALICLPTSPGAAPLATTPAEELLAYRGWALSLTATANLAGVPQVSLPLARVSGCPLGFSLIGAAGSDLSLLAFAEALAGDPGAGTTD